DARAGVSLREDTADDGARLLVRFTDVDVTTDHRARTFAGAHRGLAVDIELLSQLVVGRVLSGEPCIAQTSRAFGGGGHRPPDPELHRHARHGGGGGTVEPGVSA